MRTIDWIRLTGLAALWGASFLFMRIVVPVLGAVPTAFGRVLLASVGLFALLALQRAPLRFNGRLMACLLLGVINSGLPFLMYAMAARSLPAGYSAILNATTPLMGVLAGALFFGEGLSATKLAGVVTGLAGVSVLTRTGPVTWDATLLASVAACLVATACYGVAGFLTRRWISQRGGLDSRLVALGSQLGAVLFLLPFMATQPLAELRPAMGAAPPVVWLALAGLGSLCTSAAYILYFKLIADVGPVKALSVTFLVPLFGVMWGALLLGEAVSLAHAAGGALIAVALWLVLRPGAAAR